MRTWILQLDAEYELEALNPKSRSSYSVAKAVKQRHQILVEGISFLPDADQVLSVYGPKPNESVQAENMRLWCPVPSSVAFARELDASFVQPLDMQMLRSVHHRAFAHGISNDDFPSYLVTTWQEAESLLAKPSQGFGWLAKRAFGVAARGQRAIDWQEHGNAMSEDRAWVEASLLREPLIVEAKMEIVREFSMHAWATEKGIRLGAMHSFGVSRGSIETHGPVLKGDASAQGLRDDLEAASKRAGLALREKGYRGPFGVDAFLFRDRSGALGLRTISEINPRYCMGWCEEDGWDPPI